MMCACTFHDAAVYGVCTLFDDAMLQHKVSLQHNDRVNRESTCFYSLKKM